MPQISNQTPKRLLFRHGNGYQQAYIFGMGDRNSSDGEFEHELRLMDLNSGDGVVESENESNEDVDSEDETDEEHPTHAGVLSALREYIVTAESLFLYFQDMYRKAPVQEGEYADPDEIAVKAHGLAWVTDELIEFMSVREKLKKTVKDMEEDLSAQTICPFALQIWQTHGPDWNGYFIECHTVNLELLIPGYAETIVCEQN